jgi:iron complex transport system substrate-binding protein
MKNAYYLFLFILLAIPGCKNEQQVPVAKTVASANVVKHANGLKIYRYDGYTVVKVSNPWPDAKEVFTYVMQKKGGIVPDSLKQFTTVQVPIKTVVVTSTTHIPSLEMLGVENTLVGFPSTDFISSPNTRARIDAGKVKEAGKNESLNTEVMIDLDPDAVVGFSISNNNKSLNSLEKSGLKILYNGDWTEHTPLGKAEWIKFLGALYDKEAKSDKLF